MQWACHCSYLNGDMLLINFILDEFTQPLVELTHH